MIWIVGLAVIYESRIIRSGSDAIALQADMDRINEWADRWQMQFDSNKCKLLSVGRGNPQNRYLINNEALISFGQKNRS